MSETNRVMVNGFSFASEAEGRQAEKEAEGIRYIAGKTDMENPERVLHIYNKMVQEELFETVVGLAYLKELQEYLQSLPYIGKDEILPITVDHPTLKESYGGTTREQTRKKPKGSASARNVDYRVRYRIARMLCIVLAVCVVAMFAITATTNSTNILNYEQQIIDRYEAWEQELSEREAALLLEEQNGED